MSKLALQDQFEANDTSIALVLEHYGVTSTSWEVAKSGIENLTAIIDNSESKYVLRIYRHHKKSIAEIETEVRFMDYLRPKGLPIPSVIPNSTGGQVSNVTIDDTSWSCLLMEFKEGIHPPSYTDGIITSLAQLQALCHMYGLSFEPGQTFSGIANDLYCYGAPRIQMDTYTNTSVRQFLERAESYQLSLSKDFTCGFVYLDYDEGNVLVQDDKVTAILDFDDLAYAPLICDLGNTVWDIFPERGIESASLYLNVYAKERPLSKVERRILPEIMLMRHYTVTRICATLFEYSESQLLELAENEQAIVALKL